MSAEKLKQALRKKKEPEVGEPHYLSTGSTLVNLAFSGKAKGGYKPGLCYSFVGDSNSGKTWLALSALAEASIDPHFDSHRLIFDNAENGAHMDVAKFFGKEFLSRVEPLGGTRESPAHSSTLEEFYDRIDAVLEDGPVVAVLDSMDALWTENEEDQVKKEKNARLKGREVSGSYGTSKPKMNSARLRVLANKVEKTGSVLIIISQTRDNIGFGARFQPKTYSGGNAIKFYSRVQMWTSVKKRLKKEHRDKTFVQGTLMQVKVTKNHVTGWEGTVDLPILYDVGIDDTGANVDYLVDLGHWKKGKGGIVAPELDITLPRESLVLHVEKNNQERRLQEAVERVWYEVQEAVRIARKPRYGEASSSLFD